MIADGLLASRSPAFWIAIVEDHVTIALVLHGELDLAAEPALRSSINEALARSPAILVLDLSRLAFLDCRGVHVVLDAVEQCARQNTQLVIIPGRRAVQRVFAILELEEILPFTLPDEARQTTAYRPRLGYETSEGTGLGGVEVRQGDSEREAVPRYPLRDGREVRR